MRPNSQTPVVAIVQQAAAEAADDVADLAWRTQGTEWGGLAWGRLYSTSRHRLAVWIAAMTPGLGKATATGFAMDPESYIIGMKMLRTAGFPDDVIEVGLWHSHPGYGCWLSSVDEDYFGLLHPQPWKVSVVVDPVNGDMGVFIKNGSGTERLPVLVYPGHKLGRARALGGRKAWERVRWWRR